MLKRTIKCQDFDGNEYEQDYYFNLTKSEVTKMELGTAGGFAAKIKAAVAAKDMPTITSIFDNLILSSYGVKSEDGKRFMKSEEISRSFKESNAYDVLFMELATNAEAAEAFVKAVMPEIPEEAKSQKFQQKINKNIG